MMNHKRIMTLLLAGVLLLSGCATGPQYDTSDIDRDLTPQAAIDRNISQDVHVLWGGILISSANLKTVTQFEILAYPLDGNQKPQTDQKPLGRFLAQRNGYMEISDYTQGRLMTISGVLRGQRKGKIGESEYTYPLVNIEQQYLWASRDGKPESSVHFGLGVMIRN